MAFTYKIAPSTDGVYQADPYWIAAIIPFRHKTTIDRAKVESYQNNEQLRNIDVSDSKIDPVLTNGIIVLDNECVRWQTSASKESHISALNLTLVPSDSANVNDIAPEDWVLFWCFNNYSDYATVKKNLLSNPVKKCNGFMLGPKFVGRVDAIVDNEVRDRNGRLTTSYMVNCLGFSELDSNMYYDQTIDIARRDANGQDNVAMWWHDFSNTEQQISSTSIISAQEAIPALFKICLGLGPGDKYKYSAQDDSIIIASPNDAFKIPKVVVDILLGEGVLPFKGASYTYADLVKVFIGIQQYNRKPSQDKPYLSFVPRYADKGHNIYQTGEPISGAFNQPPLNFNNVPVWYILSGFRCHPINEMFSCLRIDENGNVLPTLVVRQLPLSTKEFVNTGNKGTAFLDLPRWDIDLSLVENISVGRSNAMRCNYVHIVPSDYSMGPHTSQEIGRFLANPVYDSVDITRAGLRAMILQQDTANSGTDDQLRSDASHWNRLMSDIMFDSHLKYNGTIVCKGIQEPICQGDNCVVGNKIYHIERISHSGSIDAAGRKDFVTQLQVTNGYVLNDTDEIYVGIRSDGTASDEATAFNFNIEEE